MKTITVGGNEYTLEYTFEAAEHKTLVQKMFNVLSGAYLVKNGASIRENDSEDISAASVIIDSVAEMVSEIPHICITAFYAGLIENNPLSAEESKTLMKTYMKENEISYRKLFEEIKECMEDDGFFDLSGLTEMLQEMNKSIENQPNHKKKQTSTK